MSQDNLDAQFPIVEPALIMEAFPKHYDSGIRREDGVDKERYLGKDRIAGGKDKGQRPPNADNFTISRISVDVPHDAADNAGRHIEENLILVSDGAGSGPEADAASRMTLDVAKKRYAELRATGLNETEALKQAVIAANTAVFEYKREWQIKDMNATLSVAVLTDSDVYATSVGTSRVYLVDDDSATQLGIDSTIGAIRVSRGEISEAESVASGQYRSQIQAIGGDTDISVEVHTKPLRKGEKVLLCTKGVWAATPGDDGKNIHAIVGSPSLESDAIQRLIDKSNELGNTDNKAIALATHEPWPALAAVKPPELPASDGQQPIFNYGDRVSIVAGGPPEYHVVGYGFAPDKSREIKTIKVRRTKQGNDAEQVLTFTPAELAQLNQRQRSIHNDRTELSPPPQHQEHAPEPLPFFHGNADLSALYDQIRQHDSIVVHGKEGDVTLDPDELIRRVKRILSGELPINFVPRADGLRDEVERLMETQIEAAQAMQQQQAPADEKNQKGVKGRLAQIRNLLRGK